jgi:hypothetical protein
MHNTSTYNFQSQQEGDNLKKSLLFPCVQMLIYITTEIVLVHLNVKWSILKCWS